MSINLSKRNKILVIIIAVLAVIALGLGIFTALKPKDAALEGPFRSSNQTLEGQNDALLTQVNDFYAAYYAQPDNGQTAADVATAALTKYGTENAQANFTARQKLCIQNVPASVSADDVTSFDSPYKVDVSYDFAESSSTAVISLVNVDGTPKIDDISC